MTLLSWIGGFVVAIWLFGFVFGIGGIMIHLFLGAAVIIFMFDFVSRRRRIIIKK